MAYIAEITDYDVLDAGIYAAGLVSVTPSVEDGLFGPYLEWEFSVVSGNLTDVRITGRSSKSFGPSTKAREWATALQRGERVDFGTLFGTPCQLLLEVVEKEKGTFNRITRILPAPAARVARKQPSQAAFEAKFAAQATAAWESTQRALAPEEPLPAPDDPPF
jgi:hypothetical protein